MQLCCGLSEEEAAVHRIPKDGVRVFRYLNSSGCCAIPGVDDASDFQEVRQAMLAVNIDLQSQVRSLARGIGRALRSLCSSTLETATSLAQVCPITRGIDLAVRSLFSSTLATAVSSAQVCPLTRAHADAL